ncbi:hypothetical protein [Candidatus Uabimicrobium amorphum]|uniref:Uncharacterized protein n=1 Tax=Uabimicrobium amorphum TaxID=2596890 RepID=A0A5S9ISZ6_UABAM|nr:hypothetical protein [Candidatus Uabimicrobium amorphum]BBM86861.1 hypothetical protein UABAM_05261 [Candidatus Uabimicrobium amorphum]
MNNLNPSELPEVSIISMCGSNYQKDSAEIASLLQDYQYYMMYKEKYKENGPRFRGVKLI